MSEWIKTKNKNSKLPLSRAKLFVKFADNA